MTRYFVAAGLAIALVLLGLTWEIGYASGVKHEKAQAVAADNERLRQAFEQGQALGTVRDRVVTKYVERVQVVEKRAATLIKKVPVYVSAKADAACVVPAGFVRLHDAAATGTEPAAPERTGAADAAPSGVALSTVAETNVDNYAACNANAEQLIGLQAIVHDYQERQAGKK